MTIPTAASAGVQESREWRRRGGNRVNGGIGDRDSRLEGVGIREEGAEVGDSEDEFLTVSGRAVGGRAPNVLSAAKPLWTKGERPSPLLIA
ncbi:hypothetical protein Sjap_008726 [Stephania japonica]|uniref:Uncharacterized protein n=1 Tax=Stephania japonica TaxID=461633 RepID=A0AAP0JQ74_9MAGN